MILSYQTSRRRAGRHDRQTIDGDQIMTVKLGTFTKPDYLAIGPYCWGRGNSVANAWGAMKRNLPGEPYARKDAQCVIFRLTDNTDTVIVSEVGSFTVDSGEKPFHCGFFPANAKASALPQTFEVPATEGEG
jgi:hypothetical protein